MKKKTDIPEGDTSTMGVIVCGTGLDCEVDESQGLEEQLDDRLDQQRDRITDLAMRLGALESMHDEGTDPFLRVNARLKKVEIGLTQLDENDSLKNHDLADITRRLVALESISDDRAEELRLLREEDSRLRGAIEHMIAVAEAHQRLHGFEEPDDDDERCECGMCAPVRPMVTFEVELTAGGPVTVPRELYERLHRCSSRNEFRELLEELWPAMVHLSQTAGFGFKPLKGFGPQPEIDDDNPAGPCDCHPSDYIFTSISDVLATIIGHGTHR